MNPFKKWLISHGIRNVDVARALGVGEATTWRWAQDSYWPSSREDALRIFNLTGSDVTPTDLLGVDDESYQLRQEINARECAIGAHLIKASEERKSGKAKKK
jgi:hypothetical protein